MIIDTHLHLWQLSRGWYDWNTPDLGAVHADSTLDGVATDLVSAGVFAAVVVQAADTLTDTDWLLDLADREPLVCGVVGYLPLSDPTELLRLLQIYANRPLVGVRQLWHDRVRAPGGAASRVITSPRSLACLEILGTAGLPVDVPDAFPDLVPAVLEAVAAVPGTCFVLDHCGKPPFGDAAAWAAWEAGFTELATRPNVIVKISGLFGGSGSTHPASEDELARVVELTRKTAGADRAMIGNDWPMIRGRLSYAASITRLLDLLTDWTPTEREAVLSGTATRVYGLSPQPHPDR